MVFAVTQTAGVSAVVAKAQFETSQISIQEKEERYQLKVELMNSGDLSAPTVFVFVLYPNALTYTHAIQSAGTITTNGSALGQFVEWRLEDVASRESNDLTLTFTAPDETQISSEKSFSVSIVSSVSVPTIKKIAIGADTSTFSKDSGRFQRFLHACYIRYVSLKNWFGQKFFNDE